MARRAYHFTWRGAQVESHVNEATRKGLDDTMKACVEQAKRNAPVLTGALRDDIDFEPAKESGSRIIGRWGNWDIPYAVFQEYGTIYIAPRYYLTRAKDQEYPHTASRIRSHM
jgi:HK97 gp10 family phage protein